MKNHKCDYCKHKGEHQEMGFKPMGVCTRETNLIKAAENYNAEVCPYKQNEEKKKVLNTEHIIKALEHCTSPNKNANCSLECPYGDINLCEQSLMFYSLNLVKSQEQKIFELENRLKETENGYAGTLFLDRCKLHDAEEKVKELTEENKSLAKTVIEADDLIHKKDAKIRRLKAYDEERDIALHARLIRETKADTVQKIADFIWNGEDELLNILMGSGLFNKQEFIDEITKLIKEE